MSFGIYYHFLSNKMLVFANRIKGYNLNFNR